MAGIGLGPTLPYQLLFATLFKVSEQFQVEIILSAINMFHADVIRHVRRVSIMATLLDIAGKPLPPRNRAKRRLQQQDLRDLSKICVVLLLIILGYFLAVPDRDAASEIRVAASTKAEA